MRRSPRRWVGVDGEGIGREPHRYTLLAASDAAGRSGYVERAEGLRTDECLRFLHSHATKDVTLAGYFLSYDWTMILRELPNGAVYRLLRPEVRARPRGEGGGFSPIEWRGWTLDYLAGMMRIRRDGRSVTVWDLGRYFQAPFVEALEAWQIDAPIDQIRRMKGARSTFRARDRARIRAYCLSECQALARLAGELEGAHVAADIRPRGWYGPGSTASVVLHRLGIATKRGEIPPAVEDAASRAFFGGRFEQRTIGRVPDVIGYDIVSAYPFQMWQLPCLEHGRWEWIARERELERASVRQACVHFEIADIGAEPWGPLPIRLTSGAIVFPRSGASGWAWAHEWRAAREGWNGLRFRGAWVLRGDCECQPFEPVLELFRQRIALGKSGRGRIIKLALNSLYGKVAQTVGSPQYASRVWAGMITSGTRGQLLDLIASHSDRRHVIAVATDGVQSTETLSLPPHPLAPDTLGSWEAKRHGSMVFVRPGIYYADTDAIVRARGIGRRTVDEQRARVFDAIERGDARADLGTSEAFGGAKMCVYRTAAGKVRRSEHYGEWHTIPARISLSAGPKRTDDWSLHRLPGVESSPYGRRQSPDAPSLRLAADLIDAMR